jgi:hypothetical protein
MLKKRKLYALYDIRKKERLKNVWPENRLFLSKRIEKFFLIDILVKKPA